MMILVFLMHASLAVIFPLGRAAAQITAPIFFTAVRMALGGAFLLGYRRMRYGRLSLNWQLLWAVVVFSLLGIYVTNAAEFWALQYLPSAKAAFIYSLSPFVAAILSYLFFHEKMTIKKWIGMGIGLIGFMIMIVQQSPGENMEFSIGFISLAEATLIIAAISSAAGWIFLRRKIRLKKGLSMIEILGGSMLIGAALCLFQSLLTESWNPIPIYDYPNNIGPFMLYLALGVVFSNLIGYTLYIQMVKIYTVTFLSFAGFVEPLCAALYGWIFLGEAVTVYFFLASFFVFIGLFLFYREDLRQGYVLKKDKHPKSAS